MKKLVFVTAISTILFSTGCRSTVYLSLKKNNNDQIEEKLKSDENYGNTGIEIILLLKDRREIKGELFSVRNNAITLCTEYSVPEMELVKHKYPITIIRNDEIEKITIEGNWYVWSGLGIGMLGGALTGVIVGLTSEPGRHHAFVHPVLAYGIMGFTAGAMAGSAVGYLLSTDDIVIHEIPPNNELAFLKPFARNPKYEPEYLRTID